MTTERYIGVDNVCAWPNLTSMPDGAIIATIFNQPWPVSPVLFGREME